MISASPSTPAAVAALAQFKLLTGWCLHPQMAKLGVALVAARTGAPPPLPEGPAAVAPPAQANGAKPMDTDAAAPIHARAPAAVTDGEAELCVEGEAGPGGTTGLGSEGPGEARARGEGDSVRPQAFKALVGRGHPEFSSARQQARIIELDASRGTKFQGFHAQR